MQMHASIEGRASQPHPTDDPATDPATSADPRARALMSALAEAMAVVSVQRRRLWHDSDGNIRLEPAHHCPSLHQLLVMESQVGGNDARRAAELDALVGRHVHATIAARVATGGHALARSTPPTTNFNVSSISSSPTYTNAVTYTRDLFHADGSNTDAAPVFYAGDICSSLYTVALADAKRWLNRLITAHVFCIAVELGAAATTLVPEPALVEELAHRLAERAVARSTTAPSSSFDVSEPLSPRDFEGLIEKFVRVSPTLAAETLAENRAALGTLVRLCESDSREDVVEILDSTAFERLRRVTHIETAPHELRVELHHSGGVAASGADRDVLDALALALGNSMECDDWHGMGAHDSSNAELRVRSLWAWVRRHGKRTLLAAKNALHTLAAWAPPVGRLFVRTVCVDVGSTPPSAGVVPPSHTPRPWCVRSGASSTPLVPLPPPSHVCFQGVYRLSAPRLHLPYGRLGLCAGQVLALCLICSLWELLHTYGEEPIGSLSPRLAAFACELAADEALMVADMLLHQIARRGTFVSSALTTIRRELAEPDSEFADAMAQVSCALRHFHMTEIVTLLNGRNSMGLQRLSDALMGRMHTLLGNSPIRDDQLPHRLLVTCGLAANSSRSISTPTPSSTHTSTMRADRWLTSCNPSTYYYPLFIFDMIRCTVPAVVATRAYICPGVPSMPSALASSLATNNRAREWMHSLAAASSSTGLCEGGEEVLRLSTREVNQLPVACARFLREQAAIVQGCDVHEKRTALIAWRKTREPSLSAARPTTMCISVAALRIADFVEK